ncbi:hypothetical protein GGF46_005045 [Coemansia sp. RSA 552]|nr:hypothetical protein GGF46_005045 [Coemansia sp. RSA 552]
METVLPTGTASAAHLPTKPEPAACARAPSDSEWRQLLSDKVIAGLGGRVVSIGRSSASTVQIGGTATTISRKHAQIVGGGSQYSLRVLGLNGVRVNDTLHTKGASVELNSGDELNFVGIRYRFRVLATEEDPQTDGEAEDWWPAPVTKRTLDSHSGMAADPRHKRARLLASSTAGLQFQGSTDTLVGSSELGNGPLTTDQFLDGLPPSSPPPMHALGGIFGLESDAEIGSDDLPSSAVDIVSPTAAAAPVRMDSPKKRAASKENVAPAGKVAQQPKAVRLAAGEGGGKAVKPRKGARAAAGKGRQAKRPDDEVMASLRELLGIVDPSECLADAVDSETETFLVTRPAQPLELDSDASLVDLVIETMVFSARTSHTVSDLLRDIARRDGAGDDATRLWRHHLTLALFHNRCFGRVERRVKDASDRRAEDRWYYDAARDDCAARRENFGGLVRRTARRCTLRDKQYFFKPVPKLPSFRYR